MLDLIRGLHTPPWLVGLARGVLESAVMAAIIEIGVLLPTALPQETVWAALIPLVVGIFAGYADQIDPEKQRTP